jgi:hypothetical protein
VGALLVGFLADAFGLRWSIGTVALLMAVSAVVAWVALRDRVPAPATDTS